MPKKPDSPVVLVVEDDYYNMRLTTELLEYNGFQVISVFNGSNLINQCLAYSPDIILMDISLQETDGLTLTKMLKAHKLTRTIPVIALTAHANFQAEDAARQAGCEGIILKPIDFYAFPNTVKNHLKSVNETEQT